MFSQIKSSYSLVDFKGKNEVYIYLDLYVFVLICICIYIYEKSRGERHFIVCQYVIFFKKRLIFLHIYTHIDTYSKGDEPAPSPPPWQEGSLVNARVRTTRVSELSGSPVRSEDWGIE